MVIGTIGVGGDGSFDQETQRDDAERTIKGEPLFYTTTQVGQAIGESDSTVRYWCIEFEEFLKLEKTGKAGKKRLFKDHDIRKMEYIKYLLKQEKLSIRQVKEYLSSSEAESMLPITKEKEQIVIEAVAKVVTVELDRKLDEKFNAFQATIQEVMLKALEFQVEAQSKFVSEIKQEFEQEKNRIKNEILAEMKQNAIIQTEIIEKQLASLETSLEDKISIRNGGELEIIEREKNFIYFVEEYRKKQDAFHQKPKGFFSRLFHKNSDT